MAKLKSNVEPMAQEKLVDQARGWRQYLHRHPELQYDVHETASFVADELRHAGCDRVETGIGRTGVVGVIEGRRNTSGRAIGLRADMDALPIVEASSLPYKSTVPGKMHACGHDGHTAILLGAARQLAETRNFDGHAVVVFQPAEEGGKGAEAMLNDGLMAKFDIDEIYALHNMPGIPVGNFAIRPGPILAASDRFKILVEGRGGHAARPHECVDTVYVAAHLTTSLQSVVARNIDPAQAAVITVAALNAGDTYNVIPQTATLLGTVRTLDEIDRKACESRIKEITSTICAAFDATAVVDYYYGHPITSNHEEQTQFISEVAASIAGDNGVDSAMAPLLGSEDFGFMLNERPGAYILLGNGDTRPLHHPYYDFNDEALPYGIALWVRLIEERLFISQHKDDQAVSTQ